jgi:hypothetical protein
MRSFSVAVVAIGSVACRGGGAPAPRTAGGADAPPAVPAVIVPRLPTTALVGFDAHGYVLIAADGTLTAGALDRASSIDLTAVGGEPVALGDVDARLARLAGKRGPTRLGPSCLTTLHAAVGTEFGPGSVVIAADDAPARVAAEVLSAVTAPAALVGYADDPRRGRAVRLIADGGSARLRPGIVVVMVGRGSVEIAPVDDLSTWTVPATVAEVAAAVGEAWPQQVAIGFHDDATAGDLAVALAGVVEGRARDGVLLSCGSMPDTAARPVPTGPQVGIGRPEVTTGLSPREVRRAVTNRRSRIQRDCYAERSSAAPGVDGTVTVRFTIGADGTVSAAAATGVDAEVGACIAQVIETLRFDKPEDADRVDVELPITLRAR